MLKYGPLLSWNTGVYIYIYKMSCMPIIVKKPFWRLLFDYLVEKFNDFSKTYNLPLHLRNSAVAPYPAVAESSSNFYTLLLLEPF
jgi:hypothetical protein